MNEYFLWTKHGQVKLRWVLPETLDGKVRLTGIDWDRTLSSDARPSAFLRVPSEIGKLILGLKSYFDEGEPIESVPWGLLDQNNWSPFQKQVYQTVVRIPHGETRTYGWVAYQMGNGAATRAVGQALRKNPFPILIPCHRVVASHSLGGFMGQTESDGPELRFKKALIGIEEGYRQPMFSFVLEACSWGTP